MADARVCARRASMCSPPHQKLSGPAVLSQRLNPPRSGEPRRGNRQRLSPLQAENPRRFPPRPPPPLARGGGCLQRGESPTACPPSKHQPDTAGRKQIGAEADLTCPTGGARAPLTTGSEKRKSLAASSLAPHSHGPNGGRKTKPEASRKPRGERGAKSRSTNLTLATLRGGRSLTA